MKAADLQAEKSTVPFRNILSSRSLWLICVTHWGSNVGWVFLVTWLPKYLLDVHQIPLEQRGVMAAVPLFVGWSGMLLGGWLTDRLRSVLGLRWGRVMPIICGRFLGASAYLLCLFEPSVWAMTALFAVVAFSTDVGSASLWAYKQDVGGRNVGSIHGWSNMWGNLGATISPVLLLAVLSNFGWNAVFLTCATAFFIAGVAAMGVDARQLIVPEDDPVVATN
jgi:ACS family glucarate transporter-like MFS transporter